LHRTVRAPTFEKPALRADVCSRTDIKLKLKLNGKLWRTLTNAINESRTGVNTLGKANCQTNKHCSVHDMTTHVTEEHVKRKKHGQQILRAAAGERERERESGGTTSSG